MQSVSANLIIASLYEKYGRDISAKLVDQLFDRLFADPNFDWFFGKHRKSGMKKRFGDFLFGLIGKEPDFRRDEIIAAHRPYFIDEGIFNKFVHHFEIVLQDNKIPEQDISLLTSVLNSYRDDVIA